MAKSSISLSDIASGKEDLDQIYKKFFEFPAIENLQQEELSEDIYSILLFNFEVSLTTKYLKNEIRLIKDEYLKQKFQQSPLEGT